MAPLQHPIPPPNVPLTRGERLLHWFDRRTGIRGLLHDALDEPIPGGASWAYVFGSGLLFLFLSQVISGVFLALYYAPTADTAHVSVAYIVKVVAAGSFLRSVHAYGSSAVVIVLLLHLIQTFTYGAYKGRRELLWLAGAFLFLLMLGMAFTGYLLPWDQKAYFATTVGTNLLSELPVIGPALTALLRGGTEMGTLTVSRFFVIHVFFLPALIFTFVAIHVYLFRKAGAAGPVHADPVAPKLPAGRFYPRQVLMDLAFTFVLIVALGLLALYRPMELGPVANPADTTFLPRPEWYYRPIFQELKYFPGPQAVIGIVVIPGVVLGLLFLTPFIDRSHERRPRKRPIAMATFFLILFGFAALGVDSYWDDSHDPTVAARLQRQQQQIEQYMHAPFKPYLVGVTGKTPTTNPLVAKGKSVYESQSCNGCHGEGGTGTPIAPALTNIGSKYPSDKLADLLRHPDPGMTAGGMPAYDLPSNEMKALIAYLESLK
ncbi:MAG: cytochrome b N-terminal domain-containing protein [Terriglobales bacterium]